MKQPVPNFQYLLTEPAGEVVDLAEVTAAGLGYAFEAAPACQRCYAGPEGSTGLLVSMDPASMGYKPAKQRWEKVPGLGGKVWVGMRTDAPPGPAGLVRTSALAGGQLILGDGNRWEIPQARQYDQAGFYCCLPCETGVNDAGQWTSGPVMTKHRALWELSESWAVLRAEALRRYLSADSERPADLQLEGVDARDVAFAALAANYRIGRIEVVMLGLFTGETEQRIADEVIDFEGYVALIKKKAADPTDGPACTSAGEAA